MASRTEESRKEGSCFCFYSCFHLQSSLQNSRIDSEHEQVSAYVINETACVQVAFSGDSEIEVCHLDALIC